MTLPYSFTHTAFHHTHCRHLARESVCREAASFKRAWRKSMARTRNSEEWLGLLCIELLRHRLRTDLRGRICLPALGSLPITRRSEQDACFADGDPGSGLYSHYVREFAERDRCPGPFARRGFPVSVRPTATASPGHAIP